MQNTLEPILYCRVVVQDLHVRVEVLDAQAVVRVLVLLLLLDWVDQVRALSDLAILDRLRLVSGLNVHAD